MAFGGAVGKRRATDSFLCHVMPFVEGDLLRHKLSREKRRDESGDIVIVQKFFEELKVNRDINSCQPRPPNHLARGPASG
jgi:hypothetical protein